MDSIHLTLESIPCSDDLRHRCRLPLAAILQPFASIETEAAHAVTADQPGTGLRADDIARCQGCQAYANHICSRERGGWVCSLCALQNDHRANSISQFAAAADASGDASRRLHHSIIQAAVPLEDAKAGHHTGALWSAPAAPICLALVDTTGPEDFLDLVSNALLAGLEGLGSALFGMICFGHNDILLVEPCAGGPCVRHVPISLESDSSPTSVDLSAALPLDNLFTFLGGDRSDIETAIRSLSSLRCRTDGSRPLGEALQATLKYIGGAESGCMGSRLLVFLSGPADMGRGSVFVGNKGGQDHTNQQGKQQDTEPSAPSMPFMMDASFAELTAWSTLEGSHATSKASKGTNASEHHDGWCQMSEEAAGEPIRWHAQEFYARAGAAAVALGVCVDVYAVGPSFTGLEAMRPIVDMTAGICAVYPLVSNASLPRDIYRRLCEPRAFDCLLRVRASPGLTVVGPLDGLHRNGDVGSRLRPDPRANDVLRLPGCGPFDALAFALRVGSPPFSEARPSFEVMQIALQYSIFVHRSDHAGNQPWEMQRRLRIVTVAFPVVSTPEAVLAGCNAVAVSRFLLSQACLTVSRKGVEAAREELLEFAAQVAAASSKIRADAHNSQGVGNRDLDVTLASWDTLRILPRLVYGLLTGPLLWQQQVQDGGSNGTMQLLRSLHHHPDMPCACRVLWLSLSLSEVTVALRPFSLSSWSTPDSVHSEDLPVTRSACKRSAQPIHVLDAHSVVLVHYNSTTHDQLPPPPGSQLRLYLDALRQLRTMAPHIIMAREGDDAADRLNALFDEIARYSEGHGYTEFVAKVTQLAASVL